MRRRRLETMPSAATLTAAALSDAPHNTQESSHIISLHESKDGDVHVL